jgi:RNA polymerase sigma-70 factor, ECF subfamily
MRERPAPLRIVRDAPLLTPDEVRTTASSAPGADGVAPLDVSNDIDALYRRFAPYVARIAMRLLGRDQEVDDLVQDVFVEALRGLKQLRDAHAVKAWLAKVTVRLAVRKLRRRRVLEALRGSRADYEHLASPEATPEQRAQLAKIYGVLDRLPARTRVMWLLRHVLGESLQAIVELTSCSQSTVQRKLREAESLLDQELHHD